MNYANVNIREFFWLLLIAFAVAVAARRVKVSYALALVATGLIIGIPRLMPHVRLEPSILFSVFLPPLLFEAAINLPYQALKRDWKPIAVYSIAGAIASTFITGGLIAAMAQIPLVYGLVFGALISPTDPISVIAVFKRLGAGQRLTLIVEAESLFNDAVGVVLFTVMLGVAESGAFSTAHAVEQFLYLVVGGAAIGTALGAVASRVHTELDDHLVEITLTTVVAFGAYLGAEALHVSGVMAVVAAGLVVGNVGMPRAMSPSTRLAVSAFWEYAGFVVNSFVFLLVGIEVGYVDWSRHAAAALFAIVATLAGRAAIYPLSALVNRGGGGVSTAWQHVLFWGGLRGALVMALALGLPLQFPHRDLFVAGTFAVVTFSLLAQGTTIAPLLRRLGLTGERQQNPDAAILAAELMATQAALDELHRIRMSEAYATWAVETLTQDYQARQAKIEAALDAIEPDHRLRTARRALEARRLAIAAEKSAWTEAQRLGWLESDDWIRVRTRLDAELVAISTAREDK